MRFKHLVVLAMLSALPLAAQDPSNLPIGVKLEGLKIPVELTRTIKAEKAHAGDAVELQMAEPILLGHGFILPNNAKLYGHVVGASGAAEGQQSHLSLVVERAEWKGHILPLHAVVEGFGVKQATDIGTAFCGVRQDQMNFAENRSLMQGGYHAPVSVDCDDTGGGAAQAMQQRELALLATIAMYRTQRGDYSVLVSKKNIHLHSGMVLMLRNTDMSAATAVDGSK